MTKDDMISFTKGFAINFCKKNHLQIQDCEDIYMEGIIGMLTALNRIDYSKKKIQQTSYIKQRIIGSMLDYIRKEINKGLTCTSSRRTKNKPDIVSIFDTVHGDKKIKTLYENIIEDESKQIRPIDFQKLVKLFPKLNDRDIFILSLRCDGFTLKQIANSINVTDARVSQILKQIRSILEEKQERIQITHERRCMNMPDKDQTGPPEGSQGRHDGHGGGQGSAPGPGTGPKTGGQKGDCDEPKKEE